MKGVLQLAFSMRPPRCARVISDCAVGLAPMVTSAPRGRFANCLSYYCRAECSKLLEHKFAKRRLSGRGWFNTWHRASEWQKASFKVVHDIRNVFVLALVSLMQYNSAILMLVLSYIRNYLQKYPLGLTCG